jgi:hypothetical protein
MPAGIESFPSLAIGRFLQNWQLLWLFSWATMLPVVGLAAKPSGEVIE